MRRNPSLDGLKFIMIFLVVLVHLDFNDFGMGIGRMAYAIHMPVFVFLSGYFSSQNTSREKQSAWLKSTLLVYAIAQFAHFVLSLALEYVQATRENTAFNMDVFSWKEFVSPHFALWYLVCLVYWKLAAWRLCAKIGDVALICISWVLAIVSGFVPVDHDFAFQRAFAFYPFFVMGMVFGKHNLMSVLKRIPVSCTVIVLVAGLMVARHFPSYMPKFHYADWSDLASRVLQSILGMVLCLAILGLTHVLPVGRLSALGRHTLWIYIGHTYLIRIGMYFFPLWEIRLNLFTAVPLAFAYCTFFILLAKMYHSCLAKTVSETT